MQSLPACFLALAGLGVTAAYASDALFSKDGRKLIAISSDRTSLLEFDLPGDSSKPPKSTPLPASLAGEENFPGNLLADGENLLLTASGKLWRWNPTSKNAAPEKLVDLPPSFFPDGLSREGPDSPLYMSGSHNQSPDVPYPGSVDKDTTLYGLAPGGKSFKRVFVRRLNAVTATPAFANGRMVFGGDNDLWEGTIEPETDAEDLAGIMIGHRTAAVAILNSDEGNGGGMGVKEVVIAGGKSWIALDGHHTGSALVSIPLGKKRDMDGDHPDIEESWKIGRQSMAGLKILKLPIDGDGKETSTVTESIDCLCAWSDDSGSWKIGFRMNHADYLVFETDAKTPRRIGSEDARKPE